MEKYSFEFKLKLVQEYFRGEGGYKALGKKYGVDYSNIKRWCANYKEYGEDSLRRIITTGLAGGLHTPYKGLLPAAPDGALNDLPIALISQHR
jgi:transposase